MPSGWRDILKGDLPEGTEQTLLLHELCRSEASTRTQTRRLGLAAACLAPGRCAHLGSAGRTPDGQRGPAKARRVGRAERWEEGETEATAENSGKNQRQRGENDHQNIPLVPNGGELQTGVADTKM